MWTRRVARALIALALLGFVAPRLAGAAEYGAVCHASNGVTQYEFNGGLSEAPDESADRFEILAHAGEFFGAPLEPDVALDAKNDYGFALIDLGTGTTLYATHTPDNIDYGIPYAEALNGWFVESGRFVFGRFTPWFDKRGTPDAGCVADTPSFTDFGRPPVEPISCDPKLEPACGIING